MNKNIMHWIDCKDELPPKGKEVLVWVDGHRGPSWSNNYALVAFRETNGKWYEERHNPEPLIGVIKWTEIVTP